MAGRALQGLGAGAVEALIPLIVQDAMFLHQRNKAMSAVVSSQGIFIIALGFASPYISANFTWRIIYYLSSGLGFVAWMLMIFFLPETRWMRSNEELSTYPLGPSDDRSSKGIHGCKKWAANIR
jgi:MFS family permease